MVSKSGGKENCELRKVILPILPKVPYSQCLPYIWHETSWTESPGQIVCRAFKKHYRNIRQKRVPRMLVHLLRLYLSSHSAMAHSLLSCCLQKATGSSPPQAQTKPLRHVQQRLRKGTGFASNTGEQIHFYKHLGSHQRKTEVSKQVPKV